MVKSSRGHPHYSMHRWRGSFLDGQGPDQTSVLYVSICKPTHTHIHTFVCTPQSHWGWTLWLMTFPPTTQHAHVEAVNDKWLFELGNVLMSLLISHSSLQRPQYTAQQSLQDEPFCELLKTNNQSFFRPTFAPLEYWHGPTSIWATSTSFGQNFNVLWKPRGEQQFKCRSQGCCYFCLIVQHSAALLCTAPFSFGLAYPKIIVTTQHWGEKTGGQHLLTTCKLHVWNGCIVYFLQQDSQISRSVLTDTLSGISTCG